VRDELFARFADVRVERHNFDAIPLVSIGGYRLSLGRNLALPTIARVVGLDLYIHARK
jgi:hypothetical protein